MTGSFHYWTYQERLRVWRTSCVTGTSSVNPAPVRESDGQLNRRPQKTAPGLGGQPVPPSPKLAPCAAMPVARYRMCVVTVVP